MDKKKALKMLLHYELVSAIAYRPYRKEETLPGNTVRTFSVLRSPRNTWLSDPTLFSYGDKSYLFMEAFNKPNYVGEIACVELKGAETGLPQVVIREPFHLSFPQVFSWGNNIYMLPECSEDKSISLYEATRFPYEWKRVKRFGTEAGYVDTIVLSSTPEQITILTCEISPDVQYACRYQKFVIRRTGDDYELIADDAFNAAQAFSYLARNAGALFAMEGKTVLPAQEATEIAYGVNINLFPYDEDKMTLTQDAIGRITPAKVNIEGLKHIEGVHSYCANDAYEVIDALYLEWSPFKYIRRFRRRRKRNGEAGCDI